MNASCAVARPGFDAHPDPPVQATAAMMITAMSSAPPVTFARSSLESHQKVVEPSRHSR
jgi:hypothetical protein